MKYRGLVDRKGELFAYLQGERLYTLDDELTGKIQGDFIVDVDGNRVWRLNGDGVYSLDSSEPIGFFSGESPHDF